MKVEYHLGGGMKTATEDIDADEVRYTSKLVKFYIQSVLMECFSVEDIIKVDTTP